MVRDEFLGIVNALLFTDARINLDDQIFRRTVRLAAAETHAFHGLADFRRAEHLAVVAFPAEFRKYIACRHGLRIIHFCRLSQECLQHFLAVGEDIRLVSISASYPGGDNYMTWMPDTATVRNELLTIQKPNGAGGLLYDVSDLTINGGLNVVAGEPLDSLSAQIEVPSEFDENKYLSVSFQMGEGFSYKHGKAFVSMRLYGTKTSTKVKLVMSLIFLRI